jgi:hypothetical protein
MNGKSFSSILTKEMGWATFWAIFFTNTSGRPAGERHFGPRHFEQQHFSTFHLA